MPPSNITSRTMSVPAAEIQEVARLAWRFCPLDERRRAGSVLLTDVRGAHVWLMGYANGVMSLTSSCSRDDGDWVIPKRLVHAAARFALGDVTFREDADGDDVTLTVSSGGSSATIPLFHQPDGTLLDWANSDHEVAASVTLSAGDLGELVAAARWTPYDLEDADERPLFWISLGDGMLTISIDWGSFGVARYRAQGVGHGRASAAANPAQLAEILDVFDGDVTIEMSSGSDDVIVLRTDDRRALLTPIETTFERFRAPVEAVLSEVFGHLVLRRDGDGDYPIRRHGAPIYARLVDDRPVRLQVFAVLLDGVDESAELYRELNDLNVAASFARLSWADGQIHADVDLVAETLDVDEVRVAVERIARVSSELIPTVGAFFGGTQPDALAARWARYRETAVAAEVIPGNWVTLTGPDGVEDWPLPPEVFVVTAHNPAGTDLDGPGERRRPQRARLRHPHRRRRHDRGRRSLRRRRSRRSERADVGTAGRGGPLLRTQVPPGRRVPADRRRDGADLVRGRATRSVDPPGAARPPMSDVGATGRARAAAASLPTSR